MKKRPEAFPIMACKLSILLSLALVICTYALPVEIPKEDNDATPSDKNGGELEVIEIIDTVLVPKPEVTATTPKSDGAHKIQKRSALRGDNPNNDLLAGLEELKYENGLSSVAGRRIKFLPTFLG